ncbi:hypothetical protein [Lichenibacterium dinghuense]|uniref:hypothetical protein n=1 Tax=Lichenibacterium dinghuense TaxID=2895977 RepID=UPI001F37F679|nr:hypothetical protein [Lichenibacterium sp. 6Y81]
MPLHPLAIDRFASALLEDMTPGEWASMRDVVSDLVAAFRGQREGGRADVRPGPDAREVVGDLIAKLEAPPVASALQARLWTLSDRPKHRAEGAAWLDAHPEAAAAPGGQFDDENLEFVFDAPFTEEDETALPRILRVTAAQDREMGGWNASSPDGLAIRAPTKAELLDGLAGAAPGFLRDRHGHAGPATVIVDWHEAGRSHSTTLSVGSAKRG